MNAGWKQKQNLLRAGVILGAALAGYTAGVFSQPPATGHGKAEPEARPAGSHDATNRASRLPGTSAAAQSTRRALSAWERALAMADGPQRELEAALAWRVIAETDPGRAWCESFRLVGGADLRATLPVDAATLTHWLAATPASHRADAILEATSMLAAQSVDDALQFAATLTDRDARQDAESVVLAQWTNADPSAAAAWCVAENREPSALMAVLTAWSAADAPAASAWLAAQPAGPQREAGAMALLEPLMLTDPASAWVWAQSLTDPDARRTMMQRTAVTWQELSPAGMSPEVIAAAKEWEAAL